MEAATFSSSGKPSFRVASPPEFRGEEHVWTPEDLFVAHVESRDADHAHTCGERVA